MRANIAIAQAKQKKEHQKKIEKGLKSYIFKEGDMVLRRNMLKLGRKGLFKSWFINLLFPVDLLTCHILSSPSRVQSVDACVQCRAQ